MKPKLRFKEFSDEYVLSDLGKYLIQYKKTTNSNNQYPVLTSSRSGIFFQEDYFNRQVASKDNTGYNIVPRNYFTYRHMSDDTIFSFNINTLCDYGIVSTLYPVFTTNTEMNSNYLKEYLNNSKRFSEYCLLQKQGGSRTYMYFDKLKKFVGCFPSIQEQTKVSNFLSLIDKKIDLQSKKIEDLKLFKKGLSNNIFNNLKNFEEYKLGDSLTLPDLPISKKYTYSKWKVSSRYTVKGDDTITLYYDLIDYNLKVYGNGKKLIEKTVHYGDDISEILSSITNYNLLTGQEFIGFDNESNIITGDLIVNALYKMNTVTVTYKDNDIILKTETYNVGDNVILDNSDIEKNGYNFNYFTLNGEKITKINDIREDLIILLIIY